MEWYIPITILPGIGMLVLSTTSQMMALSNEIEHLLDRRCTPFQHRIADLKILQLGRLTKSATLLYLAAALFVLSGVWGAVTTDVDIADGILFIGVALTLVALGLLINYSFHTIRIRRMQHEHNHTLSEDA